MACLSEVWLFVVSHKLRRKNGEAPSSSSTTTGWAMMMIHNCERFELVFVKLMCKIPYRRIARLLKQISSIQFVKLNTSMADDRFGGIVLKPSRIGSVDTRIQWSWKGRLGRTKIFIHQLHLQLVYPCSVCMVVNYAYLYCQLFSSLWNLHLLCQHFQLWLSWLVFSLHHYFPEEVLTCLQLQIKSNESSPLRQK